MILEPRTLPDGNPGEKQHRRHPCSLPVDISGRDAGSFIFLAAARFIHPVQISLGIYGTVGDFMRIRACCSQGLYGLCGHTALRKNMQLKRFHFSCPPISCNIHLLLVPATHLSLFFSGHSTAKY